jgi:hypothetical protein
LIEVKRKFGASPQDDLHCSRMFGPTARSKSAWAHLSNEEIFDLYTTLFTKLNQLPIYKVAVSSKKTDWPKEIEGAPWKHKNPDFVGPHPWQEGFNLGEKHIAAFCGKIGLTEIAKVIDLRTVRLWTDPDKTPISLAGQNKQASRLVSGQIRLPSGWQEIRAMPIGDKKPDLIQIVDAVAFIARRCLEMKQRSPNNDRQRRLLELVSANRYRWIELNTQPS